jgi:hypothetical protein
VYVVQREHLHGQRAERMPQVMESERSGRETRRVDLSGHHRVVEGVAEGVLS